jgi:uroporphyrinogen-III synthase
MPEARRRNRRPLAGLTVLVTRPATRQADLAGALHDLGARVIASPAIEIVQARSAALTRALRDLSSGRYDWIVLTSAATVETLTARLGGPDDVRARVAVVGEGTAEAYRRWSGREPDLVPARFTTAGLARAFPRGRGRILCARADIAPEGLEDALAAKGWAPDRVDAYRTRFARSLSAEVRAALLDGDVDLVTFTSASTVRGFMEAAGPIERVPSVVCIGPVTAKAARSAGLRVRAVARPHTTAGLVTAVTRAAGRAGTLSP